MNILNEMNVNYIVTEWGYVGYGHSKNLDKEPEKRKSDDPYRIIVSRSHSGDVEEVAKKALGENTVIIPAGGAGMHGNSFNAQIFLYIAFYNMNNDI